MLLNDILARPSLMMSSAIAGQINLLHVHISSLMAETNKRTYSNTKVSSARSSGNSRLGVTPFPIPW